MPAILLAFPSWLKNGCQTPVIMLHLKQEESNDGATFYWREELNSAREDFDWERKNREYKVDKLECVFAKQLTSLG